MAQSILPDTDVLVDFFRGNRKAVTLVETQADWIILSPIVVAELYAGVRDGEKATLDNFVSLFRVTPIDAEIARAGGLYNREYSKSHGVGLADAILAATADVEHAELKTLNVKHFPMIKGLKPAYRKRS